MTMSTDACRSFNTIVVDQGKDVLHKSSSERRRLRDERDWYLGLPEALRDLIPAVLGWSDDGTEAQLSLELIPMPSLAQLVLNHVFGSALEWRQALIDLLAVHSRFRAHRVTVSAADVLAMYVDKTFDRLGQLASQSEEWAHLLASQEVKVNGTSMRGVESLRRDVVLRAKSLGSTVEGSIIHGDYCMSNILYDTGARTIRLVDPRGRFGRAGLAGDPRYDIAKLRHSIVSGYDFITSDRFTVERQANEFVARVSMTSSAAAGAAVFDRFIESCGYDSDEIRYIEALLFISMPPLHRDHPKRQLTMFLTGLKLLNEVLT